MDADESLWTARIDPRRKAGSLIAEEVTRLHEAARAVLAAGIGLRGTTIFVQDVRRRHRSG